MENEHDERSRRRAQREAYARKRAAKRRHRLRVTATLTALGAVCAVMIGVSVHRARENAPTEPPQTEPPVTTAPPVTQPQEGETVIRLTFGGDVRVTDASVAAGLSDGGYDFGAVFRDIVPALADADLTVIDLEGTVFGAPYGTDSTSAPVQLLEALQAAGVDMVQLANSCTIKNGIIGMKQTLDAVRSAGMTPLGVYASNEEAAQSGGYTLVNVNGVRVALVAFTKGMDGMGLPDGSEKCVNLLYSDYADAYHTVDEKRITEVLQAVSAQQPDITIALLHWGSEYNDRISDTQAEIRDLMLKNGVDAIVGTHPHYVQQVVYDEAAGTVVAYSLGDLYGSGEKNGTYYSALLHLEVTRDNVTGQTRITGVSQTPVYLLTPARDGESLRPVRLETAIDEYEKGYIGAVSETAYENMCYALERVRSRLQTGK